MVKIVYFPLLFSKTHFFQSREKEYLYYYKVVLTTNECLLNTASSPSARRPRFGRPDLRPTRPTPTAHEREQKKSRFGILPCQRKCVQNDPFFHAHKSMFPDGETMPIRVKVSTAWHNLPSREKLQSKGHVVHVPKNGNITIRKFKEQLSELDGFPDATNHKLLWFAKSSVKISFLTTSPRGKSTDHLNEYIPDDTSSP